MRKLLSVCLLTLCLSIPVFAGHTIAGGYCTPCDDIYCYCDPGEEPPRGSASRAVSNKSSQDTPAPTALGAEALLILAALLLVLRYKA